VSLAERIFPGGPPRDGHILRLDLVESWESQLLGVERMLDRIVAAYGVVLDDEEPLAAVSEMPALRPSSGSRVMREALLAQERWYVDEFVRGARPLNLAVQAVYERTKPWVAGPAARQVHLDVARFRSRLLSREVVAAS